MSNLFKPKTPNIPPPPKPPQIDETQAARDAADRLLRRRGRGSTVLSGGQGSGSVGVNKLLGGGG